MTAYVWQKAHPGAYYLYPAADHRGGPGYVASTLKRPGKSYLNTVKLEGATHPTGWGRVPNTAIAWVEEEMRRLVPDATFFRDNFR